MIWEPTYGQWRLEVPSPDTPMSDQIPIWLWVQATAGKFCAQASISEAIDRESSGTKNSETGDSMTLKVGLTFFQKSLDPFSPVKELEMTRKVLENICDFFDIGNIYIYIYIYIYK